MRVHKGGKHKLGWVFDFCTGERSFSPYSFSWSRVTCKKCLKKRKKEREEDENLHRDGRD